MFRDEDVAYALRLGQAGVPVEFRLHPGALLGNLERRERGPGPQPPCAGRPRHTV